MGRGLFSKKVLSPFPSFKKLLREVFLFFVVKTDYVKENLIYK